VGQVRPKKHRTNKAAVSNASGFFHGLLMDETPLLPSDFTSLMWRRLTKHLELRLQALRESNDVSSLTPEKTAGIRGQILEVKKLLALSEDSAGAAGTPFTGDAE
jgi:hypothetical protein